MPNPDRLLKHVSGGVRDCELPHRRRWLPVLRAPVVLLRAVRWADPLAVADLEAALAARRLHAMPTDETYIRVKGKWRYLYRAVDSSGATIDFLLSARQNAAERKALPG